MKGSNELVVVAIPSDHDYVWQVSSEKVPHMTLLYLGDGIPDDQVSHTTEYIGHAASLFEPFGMGVKRRGVLGDAEADVLFFDKSFNYDKLEAFRGNLLADNAIASAYHGTDQFPEWTPHLTLGYPESPAKPDGRDYPGFSWVNFDRIALWTGDSEGPTFILEYDRDKMELSMSEEVENFLKHYGVKGMKWGVRRDNSPRDVTLKERPGRKLKAKGGQHQPAHEDAKTATVLKRQAKKSTTDSLSTKDLQTLVNRMNLEQQYSRLSKETMGAGEKFIRKQISDLDPNSTAAVVGIGAAKIGKNLDPRIAIAVKAGTVLAKAVAGAGQQQSKKKK